MIARIIEWSLRNRFLVVCAVLFLIGWGVHSLSRTPVDAIPDLSENQVIVFADWPGRSPQEVEDQITYPLSVKLQGLAGVKTVRATSMFGFSLLTVIFRDDIDNYFARTRVLERLSYLGASLPAGVTPMLGPDATGLGWVYQYYLAVDPAVVGQASSLSPPGFQPGGPSTGRMPPATGKDAYPTTSSGAYDLSQLRALQDWFIRYELSAVPGVAEVASVGGFVRQYQIEVSSAKMQASNVSLEMVLEALNQSNLNVGGKVIEEGDMEFVLRGIGLLKSVADIENIAIMQHDGVSVYMRNVATVQIGGDFRRGVLDVDGKEVVGGMVVMRTGENAREVIRGVKEKIEAISSSLPPGVSIQPFYDRSELIDRTIGTLKRALLEEIVLVTLAHVVFLFHFRSILIVTIPLPLSILVSFILMRQFGITSNIMSLSGLAIAIGVLVDAAIVMTENVIRRMEEAEREKLGSTRVSRVGEGVPPSRTSETRPDSDELSKLEDARKFDAAGRRDQHGSPPDQPPLVPYTAASARRVCSPEILTPRERWEVVLAASQQVGRPIFFAMVIIILAFVPVFALTGPEGKLFHPLAFTKTFAMIGSALLALTLVPALCVALVRGPFHAERENWVMRRLLRLYEPALDWALSHRRTVLGAAAALLAAALVLAWGLPRPIVQTLRGWGWNGVASAVDGMGSEFMPTLNEGSLLFMPVLLPSTSLTEVKRIMAWQDQVMKQMPEVASAAGKLGRADTATDPAPVEMIETTIMLKPESQWRPGMTPAKIIAELTEKLSQLPGYVPGFLQPIEGRILMISTGVRAQLGIKVFGDDLAALEAKAFEIERVVREVPGAIGVATNRVQGKPYLDIEVDRVAMGRWGLRAEQVLDVVEAGLGGKNVSTAIEGRKRVPIQVRLERGERDDIEELGKVLVATPSGRYVPLGQLAKIRRNVGPNEIASENGRLRGLVQANVQGRDLGGFVREVQQRVAREVKLEPGMTLQWAGRYEDQLRAQRTLLIIIPAVIAIIFLLLFVVYRSLREAAHVLLAVPFALTGGVFLQYLLGYPFSVAVWVGYIALFGTAIQTGVVMVLYLDEAVTRKRGERGGALTAADLLEAVKDGARLRLRPKVMTVATIVASLLPIMWSTQTGSEVMKPLAAPVIGGMLSSLLHILIVTPVIFAWLREGRLAEADRGDLPDEPAPQRSLDPAEASA